jgi:ABC-type Fe3+ transport system permease subunit
MEDHEDMSVTPADIEAKATEIAHLIDETKQAAQNTAVMAGVAVVVVVAIAFLLGRRRGADKGKTVVEVYKVR